MHKGNFKNILLTLTLTVLSLLANAYIHVHLFLESVELFFGMLVAYFALSILDFPYALVIAVAVTASTVLMEDPVNAFVMLLEFLSISYLYRVGKINIITSAYLLWIFAGIPLLTLGMLALGFDPLTSLTTSMKHAVNGLINATVGASLGTAYKLIVRKEVLQFREILFNSLLFIAVLPISLKLIHDVEEDEKAVIEQVKEDLKVSAEVVKESINYWLDLHLNAVKELARALEIWGTENREILQLETEAIRRAFTDLHACYIGDKDGKALTFYPAVNPEGKYMIGTNFSFRPYYKAVRESLKPVFTDVFMAKFALKPVVGVAVPAIREGEFIGYAYCGINLDFIENFIRDFSKREGVFLTLVDRKGRVIVSTLPNRKPFEPFEEKEIKNLKDIELTLIKREEVRFSLFDFQEFERAFFMRRERLRDDAGWDLVTEIRVATYLELLFKGLLIDFSFIFGLATLGLGISNLIIRYVSVPIEKLSREVIALSEDIEKKQKVETKRYELQELNLLSEAFETLARKVINYLEELRQLAYYDPLTRLPNRALLKDRLMVAIANAKRTGKKVAVLFIDLDYFKTVNDTMGHEIGDAVLVQVARRLSSVFREVDTVARFGGDEFVAVVQNIESPEQVIPLCERILELFNTPFEVNGQDIFLGASIGVALYPDNGQDPTTLIKNADMAMYKAKEQGKKSFAFFDRDLDKKVARILELKNKLHKALKRNEFLLYYQPIYSLEDASLVGFEALLRWKDEKGNLVSPAEFIPVLEETGMIREVGWWVIENAFRQAKEWVEEDSGRFLLSVNVSPAQFLDRAFLDKMIDVVERTRAPTRSIVLEITETSLMRDPEESIRVLKRLRGMGFRIAVDDFGTGYSSLSYLRRLPLDIIKLDMVFTQNVLESDVDRAIVNSVVTLSKTLGLLTLAEGIETEEQLNVIRELGCDLGQGYYFGKPMPEEEAQRLIELWKA